MCLLSKTASENILKKYIYGETTFNKMSEIQRMLLKGHLHFEETKNKGKKKILINNKMDNIPNSKIGSRGLVLFPVWNGMWNENIIILENFCICQWFKVMKRLNLATWQSLLLLEHSGLVNWNLRQFIFSLIILGYMKKIIKSSVSPSLWAVYFWWLNNLLHMNYAVPIVLLV